MSIESMYDSWEIDALTEICNMGAGHAATAMSQLLDRKIMISVPRIEMVPLPDLPRAFGGAEAHITAVYLRVLGDAPGSILFVLTDESSTMLAALLQGKVVETGHPTAKADLTVIKQAAVVTISSYLNALTQFLDVPMISSEAAVANDMAGALLNIVIAELEANADYGLVMQTDFFAESTNISAKICFLPDPQAQEVIMRILRNGRS